MPNGSLEPKSARTRLLLHTNSYPKKSFRPLLFSEINLPPVNLHQWRKFRGRGRKKGAHFPGEEAPEGLSSLELEWAFKDLPILMPSELQIQLARDILTHLLARGGLPHGWMSALLTRTFFFPNLDEEYEWEGELRPGILMTQNQFNYSLTEGRKNRHAFFSSLLFILQVLNKASFEFFCFSFSVVYEPLAGFLSRRWLLRELRFPSPTPTFLSRCLEAEDMVNPRDLQHLLYGKPLLELENKCLAFHLLPTRKVYQGC